MEATPIDNLLEKMNTEAVVVESAMDTSHNVTTVVAITKETTDPRAPVLPLLKQKRTVQSVWMASQIPPAPNAAISSVLLVSVKPCSMIRTVLLASMYCDVLLGSSHEVDK